MALDFPANPVNGQAYGSYIYNASVGAWQSKEDPATVATVSTVAPASGNPGDIWYDSDDGTTYIYYDDGNSGQWVELLSSGVPLLNTKADLAGATFTGNVTAPRFISSQATGTAPFQVASTTVVSDLNADLLDGNHSTAFAPAAGSTNITTLGTITSGTWGASTISVNKGGTGATSLTSGAYLKGAGTSAITAQAVPIPIADGGTGSTTIAGAQDNLNIAIIQSKTNRFTTGTTSTAMAWVDSGYSISITPSSTSSKILCMVSVKVDVSGFSYSPHLGVRIVGGNMANTYGENVYGYTTHIHLPSMQPSELTFHVMDSPATTSSITYTVQFGRMYSAHTGTVYFGSTNTPTWITAMELL